jgi:hypothetical protein
MYHCIHIHLYWQIIAVYSEQCAILVITTVLQELVDADTAPCPVKYLDRHKLPFVLVIFY